MNRDQAKLLVRMVKELCPQQQVSDFTVDTWHMMGLADVDHADAVEALRRLVGQKAFIGLNDILSTVKSIRESRIAHDVPAAIAPITETSAGAFLAELRRRTGEAGKVRQVPPVRAVREIEPPTYVGVPGQAGFHVAEPRPETVDVRQQLAGITHRGGEAGEDRGLTRARALLALVDDPDTWTAKARALLPPGAVDRDVTMKAADLVRDHDRRAAS